MGEDQPNEAPAPRLLAVVGDVSARLAAAAASLEPDFLRLTGGLGTLTGNARSLAELGGGIGQLVETRLHGVREGGLGELIRGSLDALQRHLAASEVHLQRLGANDDALAQLALVGRRMRGLATQLCVTRLGFSIETARLASEQEGAFRDFVGQLAGLEKVFAQLGSKVAETADAARKQQAQAGHAIRRGLAEFAAMTSRCDASARSAVAGIDGLLQSFATSAGRVVAAVGAVRAEAEELVYFLQIGDIVRQKIEHIAQALQKAPSQQGGLASVLQLQLAQLDAVRDEVEQARDKLIRAFAGLGNATEHLVAPIVAMVDLAEHADTAGRGTPSFAGLLADAETMQALGRRSHELGDATARAAADAAAVAKSIVDQLAEVDETNATMHMMALNAIVNTSRLGASAAALNVLSVQVHEIASASSVIVAEVQPLVARLRADDRPATPAAGVGDGSTATDMATQLQELAALRAAVREVGERSAELTTAQKRALDASNADVQFLHALRDRLATAAAALRPLLTELGPVVGGAEAQHAAHFATYTMESEREVHRRALGADEPAGAPAVAPAAAGSALGDNVELF